MRFAYTTREGVGMVTLHGAPADPHATVDCFMCAMEPLVYDTACDFLPAGARAAEVGSYVGGSACVLYDAMRRRGKELDLLACHDIFTPLPEAQGGDIEARFDQAMRDWQCTRSIKVKGDSRHTHLVHQPASLDYVFIDGDHSYQGVLADIQNFWPKVKPGGLMLIQDTIMDVERAVADTVVGRYPHFMVTPPEGHYVTVVCTDEDKLQRYRDAIAAAMAGARPGQDGRYTMPGCQ